MSTPTTVTTSEAYTADRARDMAEVIEGATGARYEFHDGQLTCSAEHGADIVSTLRLYADMREAMVEIANDCKCVCDEAWTGRNMHAPDCLKWIGDIARRFVTPTEEKKQP